MRRRDKKLQKGLFLLILLTKVKPICFSHQDATFDYFCFESTVWRKSKLSYLQRFATHKFLSPIKSQVFQSILAAGPACHARG